MSAESSVAELLVFDTNLLLDEPLLIERSGAEGRGLVIPLCVLEELDHFKSESSERGQRARAVTHELDRLGAASSSGLAHDSPLKGGGWLRLSALGHERALGEGAGADQRLIACALAERARTGLKVTLYTRDVNLRVRARFVGLEVATERQLSAEGASSVSSGSVNSGSSGSTRPSPESLIEGPAWGLTAINEEQRLALHYLRSPEVSLVCLTGKAGTGKTLIALAAGLAQSLEQKRYERVLVSRAIFPLGRDIGYLPGTLEEKMAPWVQPIYDNLDFLLGQRPQRQPHRGRARAEELIELGVIEVSPITYIRGRSIPRQYLIIDEAQNLTQHEVKTILTRAGHGTKVVLIGDTAQIDHPYLSASHNGLSHAIERFSGQGCAAHVHLERGERSPLAALAADLL